MYIEGIKDEYVSKVLVISPCYKEKSIERTLRSITDQTF